MWTDRCARVVSAPPVDCPMDQNDPYMLWYRQITRLLIGNPATRPNTGYQGVGGAMEAMAQSLQKIYHRAADAMHEGYEVSGEDALREIQDICAYSLRAAHEDHRLTVRPDFRAPSPAGSPFAPLRCKGRPRKRGGLACGRTTESRRRGSYATATMSTSSDVSHSLKPSNILHAHVGELPDTPQTWDSSLCASDFQDASDPNIMQLDPESTDTKLALSLDFAETTNPIIDALGKIRDICAFALRMSNGNQTMISGHDMIPDDPKTKRCKPRRRAGVGGYLLGANSGVNSYFPCTSGASSPTPSASLGPNGSPSRPQDCHEQAVEPLVAPLSRDSPLPELQDNLQLEMIELDTITGSREASPSPVNPSMLDIPCEPPGDEDSVLLTDVKNNFSQEGNVPMAPVQPDYGEPTKFSEIPSSPQVDAGASQASQLEPEVSTVRPDPNEVVMDVNGPESKSIPGPPVLEPQGAQTLTPSDSASPMMEDSKLSSQQDDKEIPEPSPMPQVSFGHPVSDETMRADGPDTDTTGDGNGKRKEQATDKVNASSPDPETVHNHGKSPLKSWHEGVSQVTETDTATARDDVQRKYKRQRRSAPKQR
ncbi:UNVERIFIED_CONTAM: Serine/threonine-protein phosphatase 7 long form [Sesamum angustifolium]|uniref:Serine/threonine-protein phosphatase 7 long form n=1 Tax=Sesamum angustifolium TaxID=2727405 RepID=A0AAW2PD23_9LAMI